MPLPTFLLSTLLARGTIVSAAYDAAKQFAWVDSSCNTDRLKAINQAGTEYLAMTKAAYSALGDGITDYHAKLLKSFFGVTDPTGLLVQAKYNTLQKIGDSGSSIPYSLYCDGSAFEWVTTYQEGANKGQPLPGGGQWYATRSNPNQPPLYIKGEERCDYCSQVDGKDILGASTVGGKHIVICPNAFESPVRQTLTDVVGVAQDKGTKLDSMLSLSAVLLHEITHAALSAKDFQYDTPKCLILAAMKPVNAKKNADTYALFALATYLSKNDWTYGVARDLAGTVAARDVVARSLGTSQTSTTLSTAASMSIQFETAALYDIVTADASDYALASSLVASELSSMTAVVSATTSNPSGTTTNPTATATAS